MRVVWSVPLALLMLGCGGNGGGSTELTGTVAVPGSVGGAPVWLLAQGLDGSTWGKGATDENGAFSITLRPPAGSSRGIVVAVDPANPENQAFAIIDVSEDVDLDAMFGLVAKAGGVTDIVNTRIDAASSAATIVRWTSGMADVAAPQLSPADLAAISELTDQFENAPPDLCSVGPTPIASVSDVLHPPVAAAVADSFARGEGDLLDRLRAAQEFISSQVASGNRVNADQNWWASGPVGQLGVLQTRISIKTSTGLDLQGFGKEQISRGDLEKAADLILGNGFGNCREKGMTGAFAASRFPEFQQIGVAAVDSSRFRDTHAVGIACTADSAVYDLATYDDILNDVAPDGLFEADCYVIDPWLGETVRLTRQYVMEQGWMDVPEIMMVEGSSVPAGDVNTTAEVCIAPDGDEADPCEPFVIPDEFLSSPGGPSFPGGNLLGGCLDAGSFFCDTLFGNELSTPSFQQACEGAGLAWVDVCPAEDSYGSCLIFEGEDFAQRLFVFYIDPSLNAEEQAEEIADSRQDCLGVSPVAGGPGTWISPYREP